MTNNFSLSQTFCKPAVASSRGIVSAQHRRAAEVGAAVLAKGGDCVDAVVATSFALGVLEPWMSGIGGGGTMVLYRAKERKFEVIDFGMTSPAGLNPADYPLTGEGAASDLFPWPRVKDDRNLYGPGSVAVPGVVAGMEAAHQRYAKMPWRDLVMPAAQLAREGLLVDWYTTQNIASGAGELRKYAASAEEFLRDGLPPTPMWGIKAEVRLPRPRYASTLETLAAQGPRAFYEGEIAAQLGREMQAAGGALRASDLAAYKVRIGNTLAIPYRDAIVHATPELTAGPTLAHTLRLLANWSPGSSPDASAYAAYGKALQEAYRERLKDMGDADGKRALGAEHLAPTCTTHFNVVDAEGNMAAVTQTLLSIFGSKFVTPESGILMNNGIMWFDPEPGRANSLAGGKRCLCNYTPVIAQLADGSRMAVGASGGRRILPAVAQLLSFAIDYGMDLDTAFHAPRIDASEGAVLIGDARFDAATHAALGQAFDYEQARVQTMPMKFACPSSVMRVGQVNSGATETFQPWADAVVA
jgi:gamma-glutamyltranspeptidase/glutathione hydrolase